MRAFPLFSTFVFAVLASSVPVLGDSWLSDSWLGTAYKIVTLQEDPTTPAPNIFVGGWRAIGSFLGMDDDDRNSDDDVDDRAEYFKRRRAGYTGRLIYNPNINWDTISDTVSTVTTTRPPSVLQRVFTFLARPNNDDQYEMPTATSTTAPTTATTTTATTAAAALRFKQPERNKIATKTDHTHDSTNRDRRSTLASKLQKGKAKATTEIPPTSTKKPSKLITENKPFNKKCSDPEEITLGNGKRLKVFGNACSDAARMVVSVDVLVSALVCCMLVMFA